MFLVCQAVSCIDAEQSDAPNTELATMDEQQAVAKQEQNVNEVQKLSLFAEYRPNAYLQHPACRARGNLFKQGIYISNHFDTSGRRKQKFLRQIVSVCRG
jgi:hypothetical protein